MAETALITGASSGIGEEFAPPARRARLRPDPGRPPQGPARAARRAAPDHGTRRSSAISSPRPAKLPGKVAKLGVDVDLLVNNAGFGLRGRFLELDPERDAEMVRVNCEAVVILTHAFLPAMVERGRGGVITVASTAGMQPLPYEATYGATKAFAISFTEALSMELRGTGVRCLVVNPGPVKTEWQQVAGYDENTPDHARHDQRRAVRRARRSAPTTAASAR